MSTETLERPDIIEDTDVDLENLFDEDVPCAYARLEGCENPAKWRATLTCGHAHNVCDMHKGMLLAMLASNKEWICPTNKVRVIDATWIPL